MDKQKLRRYKPNKREISLLNNAIERLYCRLEEVVIVSGKVSKSSDNFPYIEEHLTVEMQEPREATDLKNKIREKEARREQIQKEMNEVEVFISGLPEGEDKQIFELFYLEGMKQQKVADAVGLERSSIAKRIAKYL